MTRKAAGWAREGCYETCKGPLKVSLKVECEQAYAVKHLKGHVRHEKLGHSSDATIQASPLLVKDLGNHKMQKSGD